MAEFFDMQDENLDDAHEPTVAKEGEYTVILKDFRTDDDGNVIRENSKGGKYILPVFEVVDCEGSEFMQDFSHYIGLPGEDQTPKQKNKSKWNLKIFFEAFGIDYNSRLDFTEIAEAGYKADVILGVQDSDEYGEQNYVRKFVTGA